MDILEEILGSYLDSKASGDEETSNQDQQPKKKRRLQVVESQDLGSTVQQPIPGERGPAAPSLQESSFTMEYVPPKKAPENLSASQKSDFESGFYFPEKKDDADRILEEIGLVGSPLSRDEMIATEAFNDSDHQSASSKFKEMFGEDMDTTKFERARKAVELAKKHAADDRPGAAAAWDRNIFRETIGMDNEEGFDKVAPEDWKLYLTKLSDEMQKREKRQGATGAAVKIGRQPQETIIDLASTAEGIMAAMGMTSPAHQERLKKFNEVLAIKRGMDPGVELGEGAIPSAAEYATEKVLAPSAGLATQMLATAGAGGVAARFGKVAGAIGTGAPMAALTFPQSVQYAKDELKLGDNEAKAFGAVSSVIQGAIEKMQFERLVPQKVTSGLAKTTGQRVAAALKEYGKTTGFETVTEGLQAAVDPTMESVVDYLKGNDVEITKPIEAALTEMRDVLTSMAVVSAVGAGGAIAGARGQQANYEKAKSYLANADNYTKVKALVDEGKVGTSRSLWKNVPEDLRNSLAPGERTSEAQRGEALDAITQALEESAPVAPAAEAETIPQEPAPAKLPPVPEEKPPVEPGKEPLPGMQQTPLPEGKEYGRQKEADIKKIERGMGKFAGKGVEEKLAGKDFATAAVEVLTPEEVSAIDVKKGGTPRKGALKQVEEAVDETLKLTGGKTVSNEGQMFGPKGFLARGFKTAKKKLGQLVGGALTPSSKKLMSGAGDKKESLRMRSAIGSEFEKYMNHKGSRKIIERAVDDVAKFMKQEGGEKFAEYYQQQADEETAILKQKFPEINNDTEEGKGHSQFYRGILNALASAQTELSKNTQETMSAYDAIRQTGRVPIVFDENGKPVYSLPKDYESRHEGPIYSDINSISDTVKGLVETIDKDAMDILLKKKPVPEGLVKQAGKEKGEPVKTYKDYFYDYFPQVHIPESAKKGVFTTSKSLIGKLVREMATSTEEDFKGRVRTALEIGGGSSQYNKAYNYDVLNTIMGRPEFQTADASGRNVPNLPKIVKWLNERITPEQLNKEKEDLGYAAISPMVMRDILDTVWTAEGQEKLIPRTFLFGPKVGAYMLNRMADADERNKSYNTMDVWESRFWRYLNNDVPDAEAGIASDIPRRVYMRQARDFAKVWEEKTGTPMTVSAGQAARWYLMKEAAKKAGYASAGENETIPAWTIKAMEKYMENQLNIQNTGETSENLAGVFMGEDLQKYNEDKQFAAEERDAIREEKKGKATGKELEFPLKEKTEKKPKKESKGQMQLFGEEKKAETSGDQDVIVTTGTEETGTQTQAVSVAESIPEEAGPATEVVGEFAPEEWGTVVNVLFQKGGGRVLGTMEEVRKNGQVKVILRAFKGSTVETGVEEMAHAIRRLVVTRDLPADKRGFSDQTLDEVEKFFDVKDGKWTVDQEENFAKWFRLKLSEPVKVNAFKSKLQKAFDRLAKYLTNMYTNIKRGALGDVKTSPEMDKFFSELITRRERLTKGPSPQAVANVLSNSSRKDIQNLIGAARTNGGFTIDLKDKSVPTTGYSVAPSKTTEFPIPLSQDDDKIIDSTIEFVNKHIGKLGLEGYKLGGWIDKGNLVLDVSVVKENLEEVMQIARDASQDGVYDIANGNVIMTKDYFKGKSNDVKGGQKKNANAKNTKKAGGKGKGATEVRPGPKQAVGVTGSVDLAKEEVPNATVKAGGGEPAEGGAYQASSKPLDVLPGSLASSPGPFMPAHEAKNRYLKKMGMPIRRQSEYVKVDEQFATRIAEEYEKAIDNRNDQQVKESYDAMVRETLAQWEEVKNQGINIEFIKPGQKDPYPQGPSQIHKDIRENNHMWVFPTNMGYGMSESDIKDNPMLQRVGETLDGHDMLVNDVFRIVHDYFGHSLEGAGFGARGEENAWQAHVRMFSPLAARAMTTETRGQNSWVNFGPYGEKNRANPKETRYADQKITLLPEWVSSTNIVEDQADPQTVTPYETEEVLRKKKMGVPDWRPKRDEKGNRTGKPISARAVVRNLLTRAGIVANEYSVKNSRPGVLGYYRWALTLPKLAGFSGGSSLHLRSSELADIGVATHEVAHFLDERFNLSGFKERLGKAGLTQPQIAGGYLTNLDAITQNLFRELDYHTRQTGKQRPDQVVGLAEGWAEAIRLYVEADDINSVLPAPVKAAIDSLLSTNPEISKIVNDTRVDVQSYLSQTDAEKVSHALQDAGRPVVSPAESYFARQDRIRWGRAFERMLNKRLANRIVDLERYERLLKERFIERWGNVKDAPMSAEDAWAQVYRKSGGMASHIILNSQNLVSSMTERAVINSIEDPITGSVIGNGFRNVLRDFTSREQLDDFGRYMYARTAIQRIEQRAAEGKEYIAGEVDPIILRSFIDDIESGPNASLFKKAVDETTEYFNNLLELEVSYGLKTRAQVDNIKAGQEIYMPFIRQLGGPSRGTGGKVLGVRSSIRSLKGGSVMPVLDIYDAVVDRTNDVYSTVVRKSAEKAFIDAANLSGVAGDWVRKLSKEEAAGLDNIVSILDNGVESFYQVDPDLKEAITQVGPRMSPIVAKVLKYVGSQTAIARKMMVNLNVPFFTPKNLARDLKTLETRGLTDITGFSSTGGMLSALAAKKVVSHSSQVDQLFDRYGGAKGTKLLTSGTGKAELKTRQKRRIFASDMEKTTSEMLWDMAAKVDEFAGGINDAVELGPRRAAWHATLMELGKTEGSGFSVDKEGNVTGVVPQWALNQAAFNAMEATTNFNRRGQWQPFLEPWFLFYNAAIQGTYGQMRTIGNAARSPKHAKRLAINLAMSAAGSIAALAAMSMVPDDEDETKTMLDRYLELADYLKETGSIIGVPYNGQTSWIIIPKEREWGFISSAVDELATKTIQGELTAAGVYESFKKGTTRQVEQRLPITGGIGPTLAQLFFNYDLFRGEQIDNHWDKGKLPQYRYDSKTSIIAKETGNLLSMSPKKIDFVLRNTIGNLAPKTMNIASQVTGVGWTGEQADLKRGDIPLIGPFLVDDVPRQSQADYYLMKERNGMEFDAYMNQGADLSETDIQKILDNQASVGVVDSISKSIRNSNMPNRDKARYITGLARWALDREPMSIYPNPLLDYEELPQDVRKSVITTLKAARGKPVATATAPKGSEKFTQQVQAKRRLGQRIVKPQEE